LPAAAFSGGLGPLKAGCGQNWPPHGSWSRLPMATYTGQPSWAGSVTLALAFRYYLQPVAQCSRSLQTFSLSVGLGPFVTNLPTSGKVGSAIKILGTDLAAATGVSFNGTAAVFTVGSPSLIETTVPAAAATGDIQVTTPGGTLTSSVAFRVRP